MPEHRQSPRTRRVADRIMVELAEILTTKTEDPRLRVLSVTGADVSRDLASARVWISGARSKDEEPAILKALQHAAPYFRTLLAPRLKLRVVPELRFEIDRSFETGSRIETLLRELREPRDE
ncbi:MAG: 30S ribosome-binding factor RbfA [Candidatus Latescibacteria bacterium]|nr:30S ribosome-binding factor RbfA [Candidatus Latescibacterota bacterium]